MARINKVKARMDRAWELVTELEELENQLWEEVQGLTERERAEVAVYGYHMEDRGIVEGDILGGLWERTKVYPYPGYPFNLVSR